MVEVMVLSVLQGIAEFLPISSSGHLVLGKSLLGIGNVGIRLDVALHVGTLISIFVFYWQIVRKLLAGLVSADAAARSEAWLYAAKVVLSAIPVALVGVLFKDQLEALFSSPKMVGVAFLFTGVILTITRFLPRGEKSVSFGRAFLMGVFQAVAILPGVSRSGMTLVAARAAKVDAAKSAEFSFLMSAPPIAGAALLEVLNALKSAEATVEVSWTYCAFGAIVSAVVGYFALKVLLKSLKSDRFWLFGPYCFLIGLITLLVV